MTRWLGGWRPTPNHLAWALLALGLLRMAGEITGIAALIGLGAASCASPAPRVFTAMNGMEPFSTRFHLEWEGVDGSFHTLELTPHVYARLAGPYNRRNAYGAVLAAGPALIENELTRPITEAVLRHALAGEAPLLREIGVDPAEIARGPWVRYEPVPAMPMSGLRHELELAP